MISLKLNKKSLVIGRLLPDIAPMSGTGGDTPNNLPTALTVHRQSLLGS